MTIGRRIRAMATRVIRAMRPATRMPLAEAGLRERALPSRREGYEPIRVPIAGVAHHHRSHIVQRLALGELVWLRRESTNKFDSKAISVETGTGRHLGYIGRNVAATLAPYMDAGADPLQAIVTELTGDISAGAVGAAVSFYLPGELAAQILAPAQRWEFCCDVDADGATYLMLNCDEAELTRVHDALRRNGFPWIRSGLAYGEAPDGRQYRWYVRLEDAPPEQKLGEVVNDTLGPSRRYIDTNKWIAEFDAENSRLQTETGALRAENATLKARVLELQRTPQLPVPRERHRSRKHELGVIIDTVLPGVVLLRDSLGVMERELESCEPVLRELRTLCWTPSDIRGERVESAPEWRERRFRTGQKDDGRLYFRQRERTWTVLVSFKQSQTRDIEYLKRH